MKAIETVDLVKEFGARRAVDNLNLSIEEGELYALLGVNGAGKTTTIKMLCGLLEPTSGRAELLGINLMESPQQAKENINLSPQETAVAPNLSVKENLELIARLYGFSKEAAKSGAQRMMRQFELTERARDKAKTLSGGIQRRLSIAMALITEPKILFLDEPTLGLDVLARRELWKVIQSLKGKMTIILTTHYMEEAESLSDRVGIMENGRLVAVGTPDELIQKTGAKNFEDAFVLLATESGVAK